MREKLVSKIGLENGLELKLYDHSRPVAGDRWLVNFIARIEVDVKEDYFMGDDFKIPFQEFRPTLGNKVIYSYEKSRNFIDEKQREYTFYQLRDAFLGSNLQYLSLPQFPMKLILSKYKESYTPGPKWQRH